MARRTVSEAREALEALGYTVLSEVDSTREKVELKDNDGYKYRVSVASVLKGHRPLRFSIYNIYTIDNINLYLKTKNSKFILESTEYKGSGHTMVWINLECGHRFENCWDTIKQNSINCPICSGYQILEGYNDISTTDPLLVKYFKDEIDSRRHTRKSNRKVDFICPNCKTIKNMKIVVLTEYGFSCPRCSDGISIPNKFLRGFLCQLKLNYSGLTYKSEGRIGDKNYIYDSIISFDDKTYTIEVHGLQHYEKKSGYQSRTIEEEKTNDIKKREYSLSLGNVHIEIDCRKSEISFIRNEFEKSMSEHFNLETIDWDSVYQYCSTSLIVKACKLYDKQKMSTYEISSDMNLAHSTVVRYLNFGKDCGICDYDPKSVKRGVSPKPVYMYSNDMNFIKKYNDAKVVAKELNVARSTVYAWCKGEKNCFKGFIFSYTKLHK